MHGTKVIFGIMLQCGQGFDTAKDNLGHYRFKHGNINNHFK